MAYTTKILIFVINLILLEFVHKLFDFVAHHILQTLSSNNLLVC